MADMGDDPAVEAEEKLKEWMEQVPFSRKEVVNFKNITRDFSDGLCIAEVIKYYCPKLVDMHNYHKASNTTQKLANWNTLNTKVLSKLDVKIPKAVLQNVIDLKPGVMLMVLSNIKIKVEQYIKPKIDRPDEEPVKKKKKAPGDQKSSSNKSPSKDASSRQKKEGSGVSEGKGEGTRPKKAAGGVSKRPAGRAVATTHELIDAAPEDPNGTIDVELLKQCLSDFEEVNGLLLSKVKKLETLVKLKDKRILALERKCSENGIKP
eukprot:m.136174 g.136174  ORF g.136174 m.136174 type:complete len:263 (+) comp13931_c0_seq7:414-1202(+)